MPCPAVAFQSDIRMVQSSIASVEKRSSAVNVYSTAHPRAREDPFAAWSLNFWGALRLFIGQHFTSGLRTLERLPGQIHGRSGSHDGSGMSSPRPILVDATSARRIFQKRPATRYIGTRSHTYRSMTTRIEQEDDAPPPVEQRLPSTRPIDRRWDRSRGIIFNNAKGSVGRDFTWSRSDGIVFAETPASRRGYANRNLFAPKSTGQQAPPQGKPARSQDSVIDSHKPLSASAFGSTHLLEDLARERNAHKETKLKSEKDIQEERRNHAAEVSKLREQYEAEIAKILDVGDERERQLMNQRETLETEKREEARQSAKRDRALQEKEDDVDARQAQLDTTIAEAQRDAKETADREVERLTESARNRERQAASDAERYQREFGEAMDRLAKEHTEDLREHKSKLEQAVANRFVDEMREIREAGLHRENIERADYEAYHRIWDEIGESARRYLQEIVQIYARLFIKAERWEDVAKSFERWKDAGFGADTTQQWFPHTYPKLNQRLQEFLQTSAQEAEGSAQALKDLRLSTSNTQDDLGRQAHVSRMLTRYHKFEATTNKYLSASLVSNILNEAPLRSRLESLDQEIDQTKRQLERSTDRATRESLQQKLQLEKSKRFMTSRILAFFVELREYEGLEALRRDAIAEKAIFSVTQKARTLQEQARNDWAIYTTENPAASQDSEVSVEQQDRDRKEWKQKYKEARVERDDLLDLMRKRRLLEIHLGETKGDEAEYDAVIDKELVRAKSAVGASLERLLRGSGGRVRSFIPLQSAPVLPTTSASQITAGNRQLELQVRALRQKQQNPNAYSTKEEKQKDGQKIRDLKIEITRRQVATITRKKAELLRKSPDDYGRALRLQKDIDNKNTSLAYADGKTEPLKEETKTDAATPDAATPDVPTVRKNPLFRVRLLSSSMGRKPRKRGAAKASVRASRGEDSKLAAATSSEENQEESAGSTMNFKPTAAQRAPYVYWPASLRSLHAGSTKQNSANPASPGPSSRGSYSSFEDHMPLSQAMEQLSLESARADDNSRHVDANANLSSDFFSMEDHSFPFPPESDDSYGPSHNNTDSDPDSSSIDSSDQSLELKLAPEPPLTMPTQSSTEDTSSSEQVGETGNDVQFTYKIPLDDYRNAVIASKNTSAAFWSFKHYKNAGGKHPKALYCTNYEQTEARAKEFLDEPIIGFDIEWEPWATLAKSTPKQNVSLIQIAAEDKIGLFHLAMFNGETPDKLMPPSLRAILESCDIAKAGVNIAGDANRLQKCLDVDMKGLFELSHLYRVVELSKSAPGQVNKKLVGLAEQVQKLFGLPLKKDALRTSAWSKKLQLEQTEYAASDAYAGFRLYHELEIKRKKMDPMPPRPAFWEEHRPLQLGNGQLIVSKPYASKRKRDVSDDVVRTAEEDDDECEEFFEAVESLDSDSSSQESSQRSGTSDDPYFSIPLPEGSQDSANASQNLSQSQQAPKADDSSQATRADIHPKHPKSYPPPSPEIIRAEHWVTNWRASLPAEYNLKVKTPTLRAYHLWHEQEFDCHTVASLLRDPPLSVRTVASYVMTALKEEDLPYDVDRVREPLDILPKSVHGRYRRILERIG